MIYEVIEEIKNQCERNQMRDVFINECDISDPDAWVRAMEPLADSIVREDRPGGILYRVDTSGLIKEYSLTET